MRYYTCIYIIVYKYLNNIPVYIVDGSKTFNIGYGIVYPDLHTPIIIHGCDSDGGGILRSRFSMGIL